MNVPNLIPPYFNQKGATACWRRPALLGFYAYSQSLSSIFVVFVCAEQFNFVAYVSDLNKP